MTISDPHGEFEFLLFATNPDMVKLASQAGIHGFIVDWETKGKKARQLNYDTQINEFTQADLVQVRQSTDHLVLCRINGYGEWTAEEVEQAISAGADELFLPMVRTTEDVERTLNLIRGRCNLGILVETTQAVNISTELGKLPLSRVYVGLNDLAIDRGLKNIFISVCDGTVERIRQNFSMPFGFGGVTLPEFGSPIPCRLLMGEMVRLNCQFTFLRRSFYRDIAQRDMMIEVPRMQRAIEDMRARDTAAIEQDQTDLTTFVDNWSNGFYLENK